MFIAKCIAVTDILHAVYWISSEFAIEYWLGKRIYGEDPNSIWCHSTANTSVNNKADILLMLVYKFYAEDFRESQFSLKFLLPCTAKPNFVNQAVGTKNFSRQCFWKCFCSFSPLHYQIYRSKLASKQNILLASSSIGLFCSIKSFRLICRFLNTVMMLSFYYLFSFIREFTLNQRLRICIILWYQIWDKMFSFNFQLWV